MDRQHCSCRAEDSLFEYHFLFPQRLLTTLLIFCRDRNLLWTRRFLLSKVVDYAPQLLQGMEYVLKVTFSPPAGDANYALDLLEDTRDPHEAGGLARYAGRAALREGEKQFVERLHEELGKGWDNDRGGLRIADDVAVTKQYDPNTGQVMTGGELSLCVPFRVYPDGAHFW